MRLSVADGGIVPLAVYDDDCWTRGVVEVVEDKLRQPGRLAGTRAPDHVHVLEEAVRRNREGHRRGEEGEKRGIHKVQIGRLKRRQLARSRPRSSFFWSVSGTWFEAAQRLR